MGATQPAATVPVTLHTSDGAALVGDLAPAVGPPRGAAVVCHPHPQFGGNRFNVVVDALFQALPAAGWHALRFDFRARYGGGEAERLDVVAALDHVAEIVGGLRVVAAGYSFGAAVMLATRHPRLTARVAVAPPLAQMSVPAPGEPTLVIHPAHDQFTTTEQIGEAIALWPDVDLEIVPGTDHFLAGRTAAVAQLAVDWLGRR